jgi:hypothetical protein
MGIDITCVPQTTIKSQALADFVAEWTKTQQPPPPHQPRSLKSIGACISMAPSPSMVPGDFELIVNQVMGESNCHDPRMEAYRQEVRKLEEKFDDFKLHHIH